MPSLQASDADTQGQNEVNSPSVMLQENSGVIYSELQENTDNSSDNNVLYANFI